MSRNTSKLLWCKLEDNYILLYLLLVYADDIALWNLSYMSYSCWKLGLQMNFKTKQNKTKRNKQKQNKMNGNVSIIYRVKYLNACCRVKNLTIDCRSFKQIQELNMVQKDRYINLSIGWNYIIQMSCPPNCVPLHFSWNLYREKSRY